MVQLIPSDQKDIPDNMMSYAAYGAGGRSKKDVGRTFRVMTVMV